MFKFSSSDYKKLKNEYITLTKTITNIQDQLSNSKISKKMKNKLNKDLNNAINQRDILIKQFPSIVTTPSFQRTCSTWCMFILLDVYLLLFTVPKLVNRTGLLCVKSSNQRHETGRFPKVLDRISFTNIELLVSSKQPLFHKVAALRSFILLEVFF